MIHKVLAIHDSAAKAYIAPFFLPETGIAVRRFKDAINSEDHDFAKHPKDYTLFELGTFDDSNGIITMYQTQIPIGNGLAFVQNLTDPDQLPLIKEA